MVTQTYRQVILQVKDKREHPTRGGGRDPLDVVMEDTGLKSGSRGESPSKSGKRTSTHHLESKSSKATAVASKWMELGNNYGFEFPYNDVWLGNAIHDRVVTDPEIKPMLAEGMQKKVKILLDKMAELFWSDYIDDSVPAKNAHSVFLDEVWDDLRYYAMSCLTAAYLKQHGIRRAQVEYDPKDEQEMHQAMWDARAREFVEWSWENREPPEGPVLDPEHRERIRSAAKRGGRDGEKR